MVEKYSIVTEDLGALSNIFNYDSVRNDFGSPWHKLHIGEILIYLANLHNGDKQIEIFSVLQNFTNYDAAKGCLVSIVGEQFAPLILNDYLAADPRDERALSFCSSTRLAHEYVEGIWKITHPHFSEEGNDASSQMREWLLTLDGYIHSSFAGNCVYEPIIVKLDNDYKFVDSFTSTQMMSLSTIDAFLVMKNKIHINRCENCGKYFIPSYRSDEIYCDNEFRNSKTCKQVGYENKLSNDDILKEYRRIYKTQNARKQRNGHISNISERFDRWKSSAKKILEQCRANEISVDEMISSISSAKWMEGDA